MPELLATGPNAAQIKFWNEQGPKWVRLQEVLDAQLRPLGRSAMGRAGFQTGERVLDIGCGCAETTIEIATRVGPTGSVVGMDLSAAMLDRARQRLRASGLANVRFQNADVQTHVFAERFDVVFSRFGVMFFTQPDAAFRHLSGALRPGGRLVFVCWQSLQHNPWLLVPLLAAAPHITVPPPAPPDAPGPFSFADPARVRTIVSGAGLVDVRVDAVDGTLAVGGGLGLDETVSILLQMGPLAAALREAGEDRRAVVAQAVRQALAEYQTARGVELGAAAWIVTASRP